LKRRKRLLPCFIRTHLSITRARPGSVTATALLPTPAARGPVLTPLPLGTDAAPDADAGRAPPSTAPGADSGRAPPRRCHRSRSRRQPRPRAARRGELLRTGAASAPRAAAGAPVPIPARAAAADLALVGSPKIGPPVMVVSLA
jgi:hypothetical protein